MSNAFYVQSGEAVDYTPVAATLAGTVVVQGDLVGVAKRDIAAGKLGSLAVDGVFDISKDPAANLAAGVKVYWDAANSRITTVATGNKYVGVTVAAAAATTTSARVRLSQ